MILALDVGNTNITLGVYDKKELKLITRMNTDSRRLTDQYAIEIRDILDIHGISISSIEGSIIASVVPNLTTTIINAIKRLTGRTPISVGPGVKTGLNIKVDNPSTLGADFVAGCVAAIAHYECPAIIIDLGSATTIAVIDEKHNFLGCSIIAGVAISLDALASRTAQLPQINLQSGKNVLIGKNNIDCIHSGAVHGTASIIDGMSERIEEQLGSKCSIIITGGFSSIIAPYCKKKVVVDENLLLEGMRIIYEKNIDNMPI